MFDWFKKKEYSTPTMPTYKEEKTEEVTSPYVAPVEPPKRDQTVYKVGRTEKGLVTLSLGDYSGVVITMNNSGVDQLIRMLEASKDPEGKDQDV